MSMQQLYGEQKPDKARPYRYTGAFFWFLASLCATSVGLVIWICVPAIIKTTETARNSTPEMQMMDIGAVLMVILGMLVMASVPLLMAVVMLFPCWRHHGDVITVTDTAVDVTARGKTVTFPLELFVGVQPAINKDRKAKGQFGNVTYTLTDGQQLVIYGCHLHKTELKTDIAKRVFKYAGASGERSE
ncbi:MAG: hypothetical protein ACOVP2_01700 [Armatimonadaceae bacterium]